MNITETPFGQNLTMIPGHTFMIGARGWGLLFKRNYYYAAVVVMVVVTCRQHRNPSSISVNSG